LKVYERPGPVNTDQTIKILAEAKQELEFLAVASVTGDSAIKAAERIKNRKVICVTCPQGMFWEVNAMNADLFEKIPELKARREVHRFLWRRLCRGLNPPGLCRQVCL